MAHILTGEASHVIFFHLHYWMMGNRFCARQKRGNGKKAENSSANQNSERNNDPISVAKNIYGWENERCTSTNKRRSRRAEEEEEGSEVHHILFSKIINSFFPTKRARERTVQGWHFAFSETESGNTERCTF